MPNRLVYSLIFIISLYYSVLIIASFDPNYANKLIINNLSYGDLFQMSKVNDFKISLPQVFPISPLNTLPNADIVIMGDSFFNVAVGFTDFPSQLNNSLGLKVHNYNIQGSGEPWRKTNPLDYLKENNYQKGKVRILILESVDRGISLRFSTINKITPAPSPTPVASAKTNPLDTQNPIGSIDLINYNGQQLHLEGWAADFETGSPLASISITLDGKVIGQANLNLPRPDVSAHFKQPSWGNSGWSFDAHLQLKFGQHQISAIFTDSTGNNGKPSNPKSLNTYFDISKIVTSNILKNNQLVKQQLKKIDYIFEENYLNSSISELISTLNFRIFKQISPLTPKYSLNPKLLFYRDEVDFYLNQPSLNDIAQIADNLAYISQYLKTNYNINFIFIPMPTKYTIYHRLAGETKENTFFPSLFDELDKHKINYVDLYHPFTNSKEILYLPSDTHWNTSGINIGVSQTVSTVKKLLDKLP